jgi:AcrR family transcriptional regulator
MIGTMARPKNQAERRGQLIAAATQAVLAHGSAGIRLADIAQEAGLTPASVLYYYPDVRELFTAVFERGSQEYCVRRERHVLAESSPMGRLRACISSGVPRPGHTAETSRLLYELFPVVLRNEAAAAHHAAFVARQSELYQRVLEEGQAAGDFHLAAPADVLALGFVALEDGYGVQVLIGAVTADEVERALLLHARLVTGTADDDGLPATAFTEN